MEVSNITANAIEEILERVKTVPHVQVFETLVDEEQYMEIGHGNSFEPYIVITFSGTADAPKKYQALSGTRDTGERMSVVIRIVASAPSIGRSVRSVVHDLMLGFRPTGCSEMKPALYFSTGRNDTEGSPARFSEIQSYELLVG